MDIYRILPDRTVQLDHNYLHLNLYNPVLLEQEVEQVVDLQVLVKELVLVVEVLVKELEQVEVQV